MTTSVITVSEPTVTIGVTNTLATLTVANVGVQGAKGDTGSTGPANTLSIGTVTGGTAAAATITGTAPNQTLNLTLPKGDKGDTGATGATGAKGDKGDTGSSGVVSVTSPITNTGTAGSAIVGIDQTLIQIGRTQVTGTAVTESAGKALTAGTADYATTSGTATYATTSGTAVFASSATSATTSGTATYATTSGTSTYATTSGTAEYGTLSGTATYAITSGTATYATTSGTASYSTTSGTAVNISGTIATTQVTGTATTIADVSPREFTTVGTIDIYPRWAQNASTGALSNGTIFFSNFVPISTVTISNISVPVLTGAVDTGGTTIVRRMGIFTVSGRTYTLVARTASDSQMFNTTNSIETRALDTASGFPGTYTLTAGVTYALGIICYNVGGTYSGPTLISNNFLASIVSSLAPRIADARTSQTDLPTTLNGTVTGATNTTVRIFGRFT